MGMVHIHYPGTDLSQAGDHFRGTGRAASHKGRLQLVQDYDEYRRIAERVMWDKFLAHGNSSASVPPFNHCSLPSKGPTKTTIEGFPDFQYAGYAMPFTVLRAPEGKARNVSPLARLLLVTKTEICTLDEIYILLFSMTMFPAVDVRRALQGTTTRFRQPSKHHGLPDSAADGTRGILLVDVTNETMGPWEILFQYTYGPELNITTEDIKQYINYQ
ncbi:hypothetical protein DPMN_100944 [Dreissena polymorpha]|uniref:Uncharacterized protein n=1 Tax=Dreissena polymorpha TaxID=45954 RepID=A0A9D4LI03_DREPO|nr:hypothetical protein DPMN_100944 [Dreissena polymorpha]